MCKEYINLQTKEVLDMRIVDNLKENSLLKVKPDLWIEWDFEKNDELGLNIYKVTKGQNHEAWWNGKCGHSWDSPIKSRKNGAGCSYCSNKKILIGFNDMWATNPELASKLTSKEDGYKYTQFSHKSVNWTCNNCQKDTGAKKISDVNTYGLSCRFCSDGISFPEKVMREVLLQININFKNDTPMVWSNKKRYDFYLPNENIIIEMHGKQHSNGGFESMGGKSSEEEQENDRYKEQLAMDNEINEYIAVESFKSDLIYLRESILTTKLSELFDLSDIDWVKVNINSQKSISIECLNMWNDNIKDINIIADNLHIHKEMVRRYLRQWSELEECEFNKQDKRKNKIIQLNMSNSIIKEWDSVNDIALEFEGSTNMRSEINKVLLGLKESAYGYKWNYSEHNTNFKRGKSVVKLDKNLNFLAIYSSMTEAATFNNIKHTGSIVQCCKSEKRKFVGGFRWMYKEDYEKQYSIIAE